MSIGFRITVEFDCPNMIDKETFIKLFLSDPTAAYKYISDNYSDNPSNFSSEERIIKIELLLDKQQTNK